jgi:hypothetical protein
VRWLTDGEQLVWRRLLSVENRLQERLDRDLREAHGLTLNDYAVLVHLSESGPGGLRMSDLAEQSSALNCADLRIRAWEKVHGLRMPSDSKHPVLYAIATATQLTLAEVQNEQRLRYAGRAAAEA